MDLLFEHLTEVRLLDPQRVSAALLADYRASGARGRPASLALLLAGQSQAASVPVAANRAERQGRHVSQQAALRTEIQKAAAAA